MANNLICECCLEDIYEEDGGAVDTALARGVLVCTLCWEERVCHRCFHFSEEASGYWCERCSRAVHLECCTAVAWCQCADVICRDCVRAEDVECSRCGQSFLPDSDGFPICADAGDEHLCDRCASL
jgi:hypothetical protein